MKTTVPLPLGVPSGCIATSVLMTSPACRMRSFKSCHEACSGSCNQQMSLLSRRFTHVANEQVPVWWSLAILTKEVSCFTSGHTNLAGNRRSTKSSSLFSVLSVSLEVQSNGGRMLTSRMNTGRPRSCLSASSSLALLASSAVANSTILPYQLDVQKTSKAAHPQPFD